MTNTVSDGYNHFNPLRTAILSNDLAELNTQLTSGAFSKYERTYELFFAVGTNQKDCVERLLQEDVGTQLNGDCLIDLAVRQNHIELAPVLIPVSSAEEIKAAQMRVAQLKRTEWQDCFLPT